MQWREWFGHIERRDVRMKIEKIVVGERRKEANQRKYGKIE